MGDGSLGSLFSWWWGDGASLLVHALCGDWRLDPFAPWGLGAAVRSTAHCRPQSCILILQMKEMASEPHRSGGERGRAG